MSELSLSFESVVHRTLKTQSSIRDWLQGVKGEDC